mmetsp:Transcript_6948/g.14769  ORF Transcript_6948/g.14769 Transcript_6948/m.14769 type:complete len:365 (-) Transcript_6948:540-1634(-)|eukprot:CAMPEP_0168176794 /NCGR_PEP_ID=MMETSP0139_2-20121125/8016_1 /TAXON_ID=44445 /ORGANISM="Pseudo-nitzschia australis, Strain 10249 10 AB" /LENGTH=364 /DNA_ID=CAMNT_0008095613 /DNA_START=52 /DNA_END=1146 /DNA_ORIENTATION=+
MPVITPTSTHTPVVSFTTLGVDAKLGSRDRDILFLISYSFFFLFNLLNVCALLLLQGFVFRRLNNNYLSKLALVACFTQMISCMCSMHRYNQNDEFGAFAHLSTALGLIAYCPFNVSSLHLILNTRMNSCVNFGFGFNNLKIKCLHTGIFFSMFQSLACFMVGYINWEQNNFEYFRKFITYSTAYQAVAMAVGLFHFCRKKINLDPSIISRTAMIRVFLLCIALNLLSLTLARSGMPIFQYPATGLTFTILSIITTFVGEMDFMPSTHLTYALVGDESVRMLSEFGITPAGMQIEVPLVNANAIIDVEGLQLADDDDDDTIPMAHAVGVGVGVQVNVEKQRATPGADGKADYGSILVHGEPSQD